MHDYRDALLADMKAIGKFRLCSVTLQVFKWWAYFCCIPNRTYLHFISFDGDLYMYCNTNYLKYDRLDEAICREKVVGEFMPYRDYDAFIIK